MASQLEGLATGLGSSALGAAGTAIGGPVGGVIGSALGATAGSVISGLPNLIPSEYEKYNKQRIAELKRRQELGTLGLTEAEKQSLYQNASAGVEKAAADVRAQQSGLAAALASGAGSAFSQKALQEEQIAQQKAIQERAIQAKNLEEVAAQKQELEDRQAAQAAVQKERLAGIASAGLTGLGAIDEEIEKIKTIRGAKPDPKTLEALSKQTGLSAEELGRTLEFFASAPPQASQILKDILAGGATGVVSGFTGTGIYSQSGVAK